jgi:hypothetical protein
MEPLSIKKINPTGITAYYIGTIQDVIKGIVPEKLKERKFSAADFGCSFEIGSPLGFESLGEALCVNLKLFATSTCKKAKHYGQLISGGTFVTSGLFILPKNAEASFEVNIDSRMGIPIYDLYKFLYEKIKKPIAFTGFVTFNMFHANHIESPPNSGLDIFENQSVYYTKPHIMKDHEYGFIMGALTDYQNEQFSSLNKKLEAVLYKNPTEKDAELSFHSHVLTLDETVKKESDITQDNAKKVLHLFAENTAITKASLQVYIIDEMKEIT